MEERLLKHNRKLVSVRFHEITNSEGKAGRRKSVTNTIYAGHKDY